MNTFSINGERGKGNRHSNFVSFPIYLDGEQINQQRPLLGGAQTHGQGGAGDDAGLELNRRHPLIQDLALLVTNDGDAPVINLTIEQLYDSALVQEGLHPNPAEMLPRIERLMEMAAGAQAPDVVVETPVVAEEEE